MLITCDFIMEYKSSEQDYQGMRTDVMNAVSQRLFQKTTPA